MAAQRAQGSIAAQRMKSTNFNEIYCTATMQLGRPGHPTVCAVASDRCGNARSKAIGLNLQAALSSLVGGSDAAWANSTRQKF